MNKLFDSIMHSDLYNDDKLRKSVMTKYFPKLLLDTFGYDYLFKNLPDNYKRSAFAVWLSSRYIYQ